MIYFDWWIGQPYVRPYLTKFAAYYYNESRNADRSASSTTSDYAMRGELAVLDIERGQLDDISTAYWQTDTSISNKSWGYIEHDTFKTPEFIVHQLVDIVSKNGNLLLNIGPRSDGTIPDEVQHVLLDVGAWLKVNGEAIYGTRPGRSTAKDRPRSRRFLPGHQDQANTPRRIFASPPRATTSTPSSSPGPPAMKP